MHRTTANEWWNELQRRNHMRSPMPGIVSWSLTATPRCSRYHATVASGFAEFSTTWLSFTGTDSSGSISRA